MDEYKFDICTECMFRSDELGICNACDEGDQWEEDFEGGDDADPYLTRKVIPILETA